jgi:hypothetical protein
MDPRSFDALARSLARPASRRGVLGGVVAGALVALRGPGAGAECVPSRDRGRNCSLLGLGRGAVGWVAGGDATSAGAGCKKVRRRCRHDRQCCTLRCRQGRCRR